MAPQHYPPEVVVTMDITQVKNHAKGMRSLDQVKDYFRRYRANQRDSKEVGMRAREREAAPGTLHM